MTFNELMSKILEIMPNATLGEDNHGQIVIYTDLQENLDQKGCIRFGEPLEKFEPPEDDDETEEDEVGVHVFAGLSIVDDCDLCGQRYADPCHGYMAPRSYTTVKLKPDN